MADELEPEPELIGPEVREVVRRRDIAAHDRPGDRGAPGRRLGPVLDPQPVAEPGAPRARDVTARVHVGERGSPRGVSRDTAVWRSQLVEELGGWPCADCDERGVTSKLGPAREDDRAQRSALVSPESHRVFAEPEVDSVGCVSRRENGRDLGAEDPLERRA